MSEVSAGGAAAAGGFAFQDEVAAVIASEILGENPGSRWGLPENTRLCALWCHTEAAVDDILVQTSEDGHLFIQVKKGLKQRGPGLASALEQCVRLFIDSEQGGGGFKRRLDPDKDRIVIVTDQTASGPVKQLPDILKRLRESPANPWVSVTRTKGKEGVLNTVRELVARAWKKQVGASPSDSEVRAALGLLRVVWLDRDACQAAAKSLLASAVLSEPSRAGDALNVVLQKCRDLAEARSGIDLTGLQKLLLDAGLSVKAVPSYHYDIGELQRLTHETRGLLGRHGSIRLGGEMLAVSRGVSAELRRLVEGQSVLVVGEPGAGKSGAINDLARRLLEENRDVILLAGDRVAAVSLPDLQAELSLKHKFVEILKNWPGSQPGFLVIDSLDSARGEGKARTLRDLMDLVMREAPRWRVLASIRTFDLRLGTEYQRLFRATPRGDGEKQFQAEEFRHISHIKVPAFNDEELQDIAPRSPELASLISSAPVPVLDLLRVPFNLQLAAELLESGVTIEDLKRISSQLELIDRYWQERVTLNRGISDGRADAREHVLRTVCREMVQSRSLTIGRSRIGDTANSEALSDVLSAGVLESDARRNELSFSHHTLFDYATAWLFLGGSPSELAKQLGTDPELALVIRPSLGFQFHRIWRFDPGRSDFWKTVLAVIREEKVPDIAKLIGPSIAADEARKIEELGPLCEALGGSDENTRRWAEEALNHVVGGLATPPSGQRTLAGPEGGPWCYLAERVSEKLSERSAYALASLFSQLNEQSASFTAKQMAAAGKAARRLFEFTWSLPRYDRWLVIRSIQSVCRTFSSDAGASRELLGRLIKAQRLSEHGFDELPWLAREATSLVSIDAGFVEEIYRAAFGQPLPEAEKTELFPSRILPLVSNKRQDFESGLWQLGESFPVFLARAPREATRALVAALEAYVQQRHGTLSGEVKECSFAFRGMTARICAGLSHAWDIGGIYAHDNPVRMLDAFSRRLNELAATEEATGKLADIVDVIGRENKVDVVWRRLLVSAAQFPLTLGELVKELLWARPILAEADTTTEAGELLKVMFSSLPEEDRKRIEGAILSLAVESGSEPRKNAEYWRNRLLGCLDPDALVTSEARNILRDLNAEAAIPANEPLVRIGPVQVGGFSEEEFLRMKGVPVEEEPSRQILTLEEPVKAFAQRHTNTVPEVAEGEALLPDLKALRAALDGAEGLHPTQREHSWGVLAGACAAVARQKALSADSPLGRFIRETLLKAAECGEPGYVAEREAQFERGPVWGWPAARIDAAIGAINLASNEGFADPELLSLVERLEGDPVAAVRYQIACRLVLLNRTAPELMWKLLERDCREEKNGGVLQGTLNVLNSLAGANEDRVAALTKQVFARVREGQAVRQVEELCVSILTGLYVWRNSSTCGDVVAQIIAKPEAFEDRISMILLNLRQALTYGPTAPEDLKAEAVRRRAIDLLGRVLGTARAGIDQFEREHAERPAESWSDDERKSARALGEVMSQVAKQVSFASGAFSLRVPSGGQQPGLTPEQRARFFKETAHLIDELTQLGFSSIAHDILQTLESFVEFDPPGVFLTIGRVLKAAEPYSYQFEQLAADLFVRLIEHYLADHREIFEQRPDCRNALIETLDIFVRAGWPNARRLSYRLEELFR